MRHPRAVLSLTILLLLLGFAPANLAARQQTRPEIPDSLLGISEKEAQALEDGLKTNPDNLKAREKLIHYYFFFSIKSRAAELDEKRLQHVYWIIQHHPDAPVAASPETLIDPTFPVQHIEAFQRGKQLWLEQVDLHTDRPVILRHAAAFLQFADRKLSRELLEKALALDPNDVATLSDLAQSYYYDRISENSPEGKAALARKVLALRERILERAQGEERFLTLSDAALDAFEAGEIGKAQGYANELLESAQQHKSNWDYGNEVHYANIVLGRIALQRGDVAGARQYLLAAGETSGSPQLDSFGPSMILAKELLEKGERDAVITYLQACAKFWKMGGQQLQQWIATIKGGGTPDFGMNLLR